MCSVTIAVTGWRVHRGVTILGGYVDARHHSASQLLVSGAHACINDVDVDSRPREHPLCCHPVQWERDLVESV